VTSLRRAVAAKVLLLGKRFLRLAALSLTVALSSSTMELSTRGVGDSRKGADLLHLGDLSKITVHNFGAQGCVLFPFNCKHLLLRWREHVLLLESSSFLVGVAFFKTL